MENQQHQTEQSTHVRGWYDRHYKWLLLIPAILILFSLVYLFNFYSTNQDIIYKDVSLTGGTTITISDSHVNIASLQTELKTQFPDVIVRSISDFRTQKQVGFFVETKADANTAKAAIEKVIGYNLTSDNSSVEFSGSNLSSGFYSQLKNAVFAAFLLMGWVVFIIFAESRKMKGIATILSFLGLSILLPAIPAINMLSLLAMFCGLIICLTSKNKVRNDYLISFSIFVVSVLLFFIYPNPIILIPIAAALIFIYVFYSIPSFAVILSAFADIIMTVVVADILKMQLSTAGIVAFLMLIGYSVDTDILLTTRLLKSKDGNVNHRIFGAFKTGITMTLTAIAAVAVSFTVIYGFSDTLRQIFGIILIGLFFDILNTWISNASMLKWYMEVKHIT